MHGDSPGFALLGNAEVDSMGGIVDCGIGLDTKTSPRRAAIERAQAELRQEYDVREERKRELEFLEKGGNPLDFKFGHAASISLQSTSLTDQQAEQYVISEAKGSFALAASPHGDSVESSGRPGSSVGREPNIADNLLLFDGENSNPDGGKNLKRTGKRGNAALLEHSSQVDGRHNAKEAEDTLIFRLGVKNQAYARRNRSRTSRDSHTNKSTLPSFPDPRGTKASPWEAQAENRTISSISDSKPGSPNGNVIPKKVVSEDQLNVELAGLQNHHTSANVGKDAVRGAKEVNISEKLQDMEQHANALAVRVGNCTTPQSSDLIGKDEATSFGSLPLPPEPTENVKDISSNERADGPSIPDKGLTDMHVEDLSKRNSDVGCIVKETSVKNTNINPVFANKESNIDGNADIDNYSVLRRDSGGLNGDFKEHSLFQGVSDNNDLIEKCQLMNVDVPSNEEPGYVHPNVSRPELHIKDEVESSDNKTDMLNEVRPANVECVKLNGEVSKPERKPNCLGDRSHSINRAGVITSTVVSPTCDPLTTNLAKRGSTTTSALQNSTAGHLKLAKKAREDAILKEARIIEANLKRAGELPMSYISLEKHRKCHWDFVLEEMAWMANDFMQERLWKTAAAAKICHQISSGGRSKFEQANMCRKQRYIARTLAKAVMHFWHSANAFRTSGETSLGMNKECDSDLFRPSNGTEAGKDQRKRVEAESFGLQPPIQAYAVRFLKYSSNVSNPPALAEAPTTPDRINDVGILEMSWEEQLSEESLFYTVAPGAMQAYRQSVESQWVNYKKMGNSAHQEDCEVSNCDSVPDGRRENAYEEDEGETGTYFLPGAYEGSLLSKFTHKKRKNFQQKSYAARIYDVGSDVSYEPCLEGKSGNQPLTFMGKRPSSLNVGSIPTKRIRSAARQRVVSPFSTGGASGLQVTSKTDVSSGDTNSFQDDQSSMHGGSLPRKNLEVESTVDFETQLPFDGSEVSTKSKKKKKSKHLGYSVTDAGVLVVSGKGSLYEQRLQADSMPPHEQRDHAKRRSENQHFESNGIYGQHSAKKPKLLKQLPEPLEAIMSATGSLPSPAASQMSNMSNQTKLIKIIANRDRARKTKAMKMAAGQSGSGILWTTFEDQALVVLVHDMGPNWELVSDAINSTLQFKCVFRKPKECKERHKFLMDKSAGDGADSAEDSGSSQPYPSTLPGIPKGSARQLFQRLQGPMEEDTLKAHFEKIILLGQQLHSRRSQNDNQEIKHIPPVHSSHVVALSQTIPNNLTGGVLTPLDLCDAIASSQDILGLGYQGSHSGGVAMPSHQGSLPPVLSASSANAMLQGSPGIVLGSGLPSPSAPLNAPARDAQRYGMPRANSLPVDDQQRMQYTQMLSGRNLQQSNLSVPGALPVGVDRNVRVLPGGNGVGMMGGSSRTMPMTRPGFQGISPPAMLNMVSTGSMLSGGGVGMQNPVNVHPSAVPVPGNSVLRPRDALQMMRPGQNAEDHRQMMMQDLQLQVSQGNPQAVPAFNGMNAPFPNATGPPSLQTYPGQQHQQSHQMLQQSHILGNPQHSLVHGTNHSSSQQQAYAIRFAKERQLQQRMLPQPQQQYTCSSAMSTIQNSSQIQQPAQPSSSVTPTPQTPLSKQHMPPQSNPGLSNQMMKQRQRQQVQQQQPRHQQQQKQLSQQQSKLMKSLGRGNVMIHQNLPGDPSHVSGLSAASRNHVSEKQLMQQGQGFFPGNPTLSQSSNHHKLYSRPSSQSSKQMPSLPSHSDTCNQGPMQVPNNHTMIPPQQASLPSSLPLATQPPSQQQQQRQINQSQQNMQRMMLQQNRQVSSDGRMQTSADQVQLNQMVPGTSLPRCTDSSGSVPVVSSAAQWKPEPLYDTSTPTSTAGSPQESLVGTDTLVPPSSEGLAQRQFVGNASMHGHGVGTQWQQQQQPQQQPQHQHRQAVQGNLYPRTSNSGPG